MLFDELPRIRPDGLRAVGGDVQRMENGDEDASLSNALVRRHVRPAHRSDGRLALQNGNRHAIEGDDSLRRALLEDLEISLGEIANQSSVPIADHDRYLDQLDAGAE